MTAIGLVMCVIVAAPILLAAGQQGGRARQTFNRLTAVAVIGGALLFVSRTAALSLIIGVVFGLMRASSGMRRGRKTLQRAVGLVSVLVVAGLLNRNAMEAVWVRLVTDVSDTTGVNGRIDLYENALRNWMSSDKSVVFGNGYFVSNPHNEFLRTLDCDGLIGIIAFFVLMMGVYIVCCRGPQYNVDQILGQNILFGYILSAMMTYSHTKTMWLAYMFLLAGYLEAQARSVGFRKGAGVVVEHFRIPGRVSAFSQG